jgi:hypothetical protein
MLRRHAYLASCAAIALAAGLSSSRAEVAQSPLVPAGATNSAGAAQYRDPSAMTQLSPKAKLALLKQK